jgi:hypothetical protein
MSRQQRTSVNTVTQILSGLCVSHVWTWSKPVHQWRNQTLRARLTLWLKWSRVPSCRNTHAVYFSRRVLQFTGMEPVLIFRGNCLCKWCFLLKRKVLPQCHTEVQNTRSLSGCHTCSKNFVWLFCSPFSSVVAVVITINLKRCLVCEKHSFQISINFINLQFTFVSLFGVLVPLISGLKDRIIMYIYIFFFYFVRIRNSCHWAKWQVVRPHIQTEKIDRKILNLPSRDWYIAKDYKS